VISLSEWRNLPSRVHWILYGCSSDDIAKQIARHPDLRLIDRYLDLLYPFPENPPTGRYYR
jgi:hypothetical protein